MIPKIFFPRISELQIFSVWKWWKMFCSSLNNPGCSAEMDGIQQSNQQPEHSPEAESLASLLSSLVETAYMQSPCHTAATLSSWAISTYSHTTSWQAFCGRSEQPAIQIDGDNECCSFPSAKKQRKIILPLQKVSKRVGGAWIVWSVAQPIGSLW